MSLHACVQVHVHTFLSLCQRVCLDIVTGARPNKCWGSEIAHGHVFEPHLSIHHAMVHGAQQLRLHVPCSWCNHAASHQPNSS